MTNARSYSNGPGMSRTETVAGFCYLPFYLVLLSIAISHTAALLGIKLNDLTMNICYFSLNALFTVLIFRRFLASSFRAIRFWELVQAIILGFALYYALTRVLTLLIAFLDVKITSFNDETVAELVSADRRVIMVCTIIIAPIVEETLVRGLVFGTVRRKNRIAAHLVNILLFSLMHVWQYIPTEGWGPVALAAMEYIPASIALGWTYEKAKTIWAPIFLHMIVNGIGMCLI